MNRWIASVRSFLGTTKLSQLTTPKCDPVPGRSENLDVKAVHALEPQPTLQKKTIIVAQDAPPLPLSKGYLLTFGPGSRSDRIGPHITLVGTDQLSNKELPGQHTFLGVEIDLHGFVKIHDVCLVLGLLKQSEVPCSAGNYIFLDPGDPPVVLPCDENPPACFQLRYDSDGKLWIEKVKRDEGRDIALEQQLIYQKPVK